MEFGPRDQLSQAFVHEHNKGRTVDAPCGPVVYLDLRHLGADLIDAKLPFVRELCRDYQHIDLVVRWSPVTGSAHDGWRSHRYQRRHNASRAICRR